ncbi:MAG: Crp/Fnr family transcriptional regulator [Chthonomonadales bacterium]|nr:Crp/Fnr family transcriptional regulator [Chthonomonadales bacterium]
MNRTDASTTDLLKGIPLFASLDAAAIGELAARCRRRQFAGGTALFHAGDPGHTLYIVVSGSVSIQHETAEGVTVHIAQRGPGEIIGDMALIDGKPRMADAVTAAPAELVMLDREAFVACVERSPRIAFGVMSHLAERLREAGRRLESRQSLDVRGRLAERLLELAATHGREDPRGGVRLEVRVSQQSLAEQIGTTRETVNRELSRMREVRAVRLDGRTIVLTDSRKLQRYAGR